MKSMMMEMMAAGVLSIKFHISLKWKGNPIMAQTRTTKKATKPIYDSADFSDIHLAIDDNFSIILLLSM